MTKIIVGFSLLLFFQVGCDSMSDQGLTKARLLIDTGKMGGVQYKTITFKTLKYHGKLESDFGAYYSGAVIGGDLKDLYQTRGELVKLKINIDGDTMIPMTYHSNLLLTHYYYIEQLIEFWQERGLDFTDVKYNVYYEPSYSLTYDDSNFLIKKKANAAFMPFEKKGYKAFFVYSKDPKSDLPIAMNFAVWAHEFGHNMFDKAFARRDSKVSHKGFRRGRYYLSAMNEGIADFFSSVVTGSNLESMQLSLAEGLEQRVLPVNFKSSSLSEDSSFYRWGSVLASCLYEIGEEIGQEKVALQVYEALKGLREDWDSNEPGFNFHHLAKRMIKIGFQSNHGDLYKRSFLKWFDDEKNRSKILAYH